MKDLIDRFFKDKEQLFTSSEFMRMLNELKAFEKFKRELRANEEEETKEQNSSIIGQLLCNENSITNLEASLVDGNTNLIDLQKHEHLLRQWFDDRLL